MSNRIVVAVSFLLILTSVMLFHYSLLVTSPWAAVAPTLLSAFHMIVGVNTLINLTTHKD